MKGSKFPVIEIFGPTMQGEGIHAGKATHFLRLAACTYRCFWCDTPEAVLPLVIRNHRTIMTPEEIITKITLLDYASTLTITGGDPCIHKYFGNVIKALRECFPGMKLNVETQGAVFVDWLSNVDHITFSPKPPSSRMKTDHKILERMINYAEAFTDVSLKIVVFDDEDFYYACDISNKYPKIDFTFQVGTDTSFRLHTSKPLTLMQQRNNLCNSYNKLVHRVLYQGPKRSNINVLPQLHVLVWGSKKGV